MFEIVCRFVARQDRSILNSGGGIAMDGSAKS
jgi:hypothetical protein